MNRRDFIRSAVIGGAALTIAPGLLASQEPAHSWPKANPSVRDMIEQWQAELAKCNEHLLFDPSHREEFVARQIEAARHLYPKIKVICDETNNSQEDINNGYLNIFLVYTTS